MSNPRPRSQTMFSVPWFVRPNIGNGSHAVVSNRSIAAKSSPARWHKSMSRRSRERPRRIRQTSLASPTAATASTSQIMRGTLRTSWKKGRDGRG